MSAFLNTITISHVIEFLEKCFAHSKSVDFENYAELIELNTELPEITMDMPEIDLVDIKIKDDVMGQGANALEKLIFAAYNDAKAKADDLIDRVMGEATAGMPMPE